MSEIKKKIIDHDQSKYITTQEFNRLIVENFAVRLKQPNLGTKTDIDDFVEKTDFDDKLKNLNKRVTSNKIKKWRGWKRTHWSNKKRWTDIRKSIWFFVR